MGKRKEVQNNLGIQEKSGREAQDMNSHIFYELVDGLDSIVTVSDLETGEVLFYNESANKVFELNGDGIGKHCWEVFQGRTDACPWCTNDILKENPGEALVWENYEEKHERYFRNTDKITEWPDGRKVHFRESVDITDIKNSEACIQKRYKQQELVTEITKTFLSNQDIQRSVRKSLDMMGRFIGVDRIMLVTRDKKTNRFHIQSYWGNKNNENIPNFLKRRWKKLEEIHNRIFIEEKRPYIKENCIPEQSLDMSIQGDVRACLSIPIYGSDSLLGVISLMHLQPREWTKNEMQIVSLTGNVFGGVLGNIETENRLQRISSIVENSPYVFVFLNDRFRVEYINPASYEIFGYTKEELESSRYSVIMDRDTYRYLANEVFPLAYKGNEFNMDINLRRKDGKTCIWAVKIFQVPDSNGKKGVALAGFDVTERKQLQEELSRAKEEAERASQAKGNFLSNMSHEIRTPMTAIMGLVEIALQSDDTGEIKSQLLKMKTSSYHLLNLLNDILDMSKIESGNLKISEDVFSLDKMISELMVLIDVKAKEKKQKIVVNVAEDVPKQLFGDSMRLTQVIMNLLSNAIKFSPSSTQIIVDICVEERGKEKVRLAFSVKDEGVGIEEEKIKHIFMPFRQADASVTKRFGGTGLGLAISKAIVEKMEGDIRVESREGEGSTFAFSAHFGIVEEAAGQEEEDHRDSEIPDYRDKCFLVVEDNEINREIIRFILGPTGANIYEAENGEIAVKMYMEDSQRYNFIFMDIQMPVMDGYTTSRKIRASGECGCDRIPIVAITANVFKDDVDCAMEAKMSAHIGKPIDASEVYEVMARFL